MSVPDPATPTVAAPAPMNLAAESMSRTGAEVCRARDTMGDTLAEGAAHCWLTNGEDMAPDRGRT